MNRLEELENKSIFILREAYANLKNLCMLWSIGKDSTALLWLVRKAFFGHIPIPLVHIDTGFKIKEMIDYRDKLTKELGLTMIVGKNEIAMESKNSFPDGKVDRITCCKLLKTEALKNTLSGKSKRYIYDHTLCKYKEDNTDVAFTGVILGIRADEEGSRSKERYFSARDQESNWQIGSQAPEFWNQFNTDFPPNSHIRIHPLLDWTEIDIWEYIEKEKIPTVSLYYNQGLGKRYRSLGCQPCTFPIDSEARTVKEIIEELKTGKYSKIAERSGRAQDKDDGGGLETLRKNGYM